MLAVRNYINSTPYIGIPFKDKGRDFDGVDCWGLLRLIYKQEFNIELPSLSDAYISSKDLHEISELVHTEIDRMQCWKLIDSYPISFKNLQVGDGLLIRFGRNQSHVAVYSGNNRMLQILEKEYVTNERMDTVLWTHRIVEVYRHKELLSGE